MEGYSQYEKGNHQDKPHLESLYRTLSVLTDFDGNYSTLKGAQA
jgi:hypothetical protein